jgi:hypothetical protein
VTFAVGHFTDRFPNALHCTATAAPLQPWPPRTLPTSLIPFALPLPLLLHNRDYTRAGSPPLSRAKQRTRTSRMLSRAPSRARCHTTYIQRNMATRRSVQHITVRCTAAHPAELVSLLSLVRRWVGSCPSLTRVAPSTRFHRAGEIKRTRARMCAQRRTHDQLAHIRARTLTQSTRADYRNGILRMQRR